jgi:hypothetical protein
MAIDRATFFRHLEETGSVLFPDGMTMAQKQGLSAKLDVWEEAYAADNPPVFLAAALGQIHWETGGRLEPVLEAFAANRGQSADKLQAAYDAGRLSWVKTPYWLPDESGQVAVGGGDIQLTHRRNYVFAEERLRERFGREFGLDRDYDRILDPAISAHVAFAGMIEGWFRPCKLADFLDADGRLDYRAARDIVNGDTGRVGDRIRDYCTIYEGAIRAASEADS